MSIDAKTVKALRDKTGAGMMDCKKALLESDGDMEKAIEWLRVKGLSKAAKKGARTAKEGVIFSYIHQGGRLGVLVELNCETDFVAKTESFSELSHNLAMQIAATNPLAIQREDIDQMIIDHEKEIFTEQTKDSGKPKNVIEKIVEGRMEKFYAESCLLEQPFIKDSDRKVGDLITELVATLGENIIVNRFTRYAIGEASSNGQPH